MICKKCNLDLDVSFFCVDKTRKNGRHPYCRNCRKRPYNKDYANKYYLKNSDKIKKFSSEYKKENKEKVKERNKVYIKNRRLDPRYKLESSLRSRISWVIRKKFQVSSSFVSDFLGCSFNDLKIYIESKFQDGMSWDNYGINGWHIDHIKPLSLAKNYDEFKKLYHFTNLQPLWSTDNRKKSNKWQ